MRNHIKVRRMKKWFCRRAIRALPIVLLLLAVGNVAGAQTVTVERGDVYVRANDAEPAKQITSLGDVQEAVLSPDHKTIAFIRDTPEVIVFTGDGDCPAGEIWVVRVDGTGSRRLLRGRKATKMDQVLGGLRELQFSPDGKKIYFTSQAWATSGAVHVVEIESGAERFVCGGNLMQVIPRGRYAGHLILSQHRYFLGHGSYDWAWLFTPGGREVAPIAGDEASFEEQLKSFREEYIPPAGNSPSPKKGRARSQGLRPICPR